MAVVKKHKIGDNVITSIRKWTVGRAPKKGTPYVRVDLEGYISWTGWLTRDAMEYTLATLEKMGYKYSDVAGLTRDDALSTELSLIAVIGSTREYKGKTYYDADFINSVATGGFVGGDNVNQDLLDELKGMDTRAYINGAKDYREEKQKEQSSNSDYDIPSGFTSEDIPF